MKTLHRAIVVMVFVVTLTYAAAPPGRWRALTKEEAKYVAALDAKLEQHADKGEFEQAAKVAEGIVEYRTERQGERHHEAIDARYAVEEWQRLGKVTGKDRPEVIQARKLNRKGVQLVNQGRAREAEQLVRQALKIRSQVLGERHPATAQCYNNLASCLEAQGKSREALPLLLKTLQIWQKVLGENHPYTAGSYNNVATALNSQGKSAEALPMYKKALEIRQRVLGESHPDTALSFNNMAHCLGAQGKVAEALPLYLKALKINRRVLGESHPNTATCSNGVAYCLQSQGKQTEAMPLFQKALKIHRSILGEYHPDTASSYNNVAYCLYSQGKSAEALPLYLKSLQIRLLVLGERHPDSATSYSGTGTCLNAEGKQSDALVMFRKALEIRRQVLGERHPDTARNYNNLATFLITQGKFEEALSISQQALGIHQEVLGEHHPATAASYNNLATCMVHQGKASAALPFYLKAVKIGKQILGEHHLYTAGSYNNLALCLHRMNRSKDAVLAFEKALKGFEYGRIFAGDTGFDRSQFQVKVVTPNAGLSVSLVRLNEPSRAWAMAESDFGRGLLDDLSVLYRVSAEEQKQILEVESLQKQILPLVTTEKPSDPQKKELTGLVEQRNKLQRDLAENAVRRARQRVASLAEVQKQLSSDTAIVFWLDIDTLKEHLGCVVRHKGDPQWVTLSGTGAKSEWSEEDTTLVSRTQAVIRETDANRLPGLLEAVRRQRLAPLEKHLKGIRHLIVLPTGKMSAFPVEVLTDRYTISYAPSATIYAKQRQQHRAFEAKSALVLADPVFEREKPKEPTPPAHGLLVTSVLPKSLGLRIGLQPGDVLLEYDGKKLNKLEDLQYPKEEKTVIVTLWRNGGKGQGRIPGGNLGLTFDKRPIEEALKDWRQRQDKLMAFARGKDWTALPGTLVEARTLKSLIPTANLLLGSEASEAKLGELATSGILKDYRILHLATHGEANAKLPLQTALILSQDKLPTQKQQEERVLAGKKPLEGKLTVETVLRDWKLDADLVVLSACETGLGQDTYREGMLGFTQALLKKGARSVLLTRWEVDDAGTSLLMRRFYQNVMGKRDGLKKAMPRAEALKEAKLWLRNLTSVEAQKELAVMLDSVPRGDRGKIVAAKKVRVPATQPMDKKDRPFDHPYYWAAFILIGDPE